MPVSKYNYENLKNKYTELIRLRTLLEDTEDRLQDIERLIEIDRQTYMDRRDKKGEEY